MVCCFNDNALIVGAVDEEKAFHGFREERLAPRCLLTIQHEGGRSPLVNKTSSSQLPLQEVPRPLALGARPEQLVALVIHDGVASTVHVPFYVELPDALAGPIRPVNANDVLSVFHGKPDVEDELVERSCLVAALSSGEIRAVVLESLDGGDHWS